MQAVPSFLSCLEHHKHMSGSTPVSREHTLSHFKPSVCSESEKSTFLRICKHSKQAQDTGDVISV